MTLPRVSVYGLWHLGCVTAAALAQEGFHVQGVDADRGVIDDLQRGQAPIFEPGLDSVILEGTRAKTLTFTADLAEGLKEADLVWVTFDTPVDEHDRADVGYVTRQVDAAFPYLRSGTTVLISSQVPVGFTGQLARSWRRRDREKVITFAYSPENLRLGSALATFRAVDRTVVGLNGDEGRDVLEAVLNPFCPRLEWMSIESAEMTKHSLNAFLAVSVAMTNEIARICELTGADAKQVERGLKSEIRIGKRAYVAPGAPFAGGTLARDLRFLTSLGEEYGLDVPLLAGALESNEKHKSWLRSAVYESLAAGPRPARVVILGLTYKPGTDTLRRSESVALAGELADHGVEVTIHDPSITGLPSELNGLATFTRDLSLAIKDADLLVLATPSPVYRDEVTAALVVSAMRRPTVIDQSRYLEAELAEVSAIDYRAVGRPKVRE